MAVIVYIQFFCWAAVSFISPGDAADCGGELRLPRPDLIRAPAEMIYPHSVCLSVSPCRDPASRRAEYSRLEDARGLVGHQTGQGGRNRDEV